MAMRLRWRCVRTVQLNHALGISNLVRIFDPQLVVIGWANVALSDACQDPYARA